MPEIDPSKPLFTIGIVADILGIPQRILRAYEEKEIIKPSRSVSNRRLYSLRDLENIEYVHYLTQVKKVNAAGIKVIFSLLGKLKEKERKKLLVVVEQGIEKAGVGRKKVL